MLFFFLAGMFSIHQFFVRTGVIFNAHRPMYTSSEVGGGIAMVEELRRSIEPLLLEYDVDVVLVGHVHKYERTW